MFQNASYKPHTPVSSKVIRTRVVASFAIPEGWLRKASLGWSPNRLNGSGIFWGSLENIFRPSMA